ncbi:MAG: hypothetical protein SPD11_14875 [Sphaerochaetaceae bacterium]|nr:hypothetical protein [Sphaerochaetaceae bacterium]
MQRGMRMTLRLPRRSGQDLGEVVLAELVSYGHKQSGTTLATMRTSLFLKEIVPYTPVYNTKVVSSGPNVPPPIKGADGESAKYVALSLSDSLFHYTYDGVAHDNQRITARCDKLGISDALALTIGDVSVPLDDDGVGVITPGMLLEDSAMAVVVAGDYRDSKCITRILDKPLLSMGLSRESVRYYADGAPHPDQDVLVTVETQGLAEKAFLTCDGISYDLVHGVATIPASVLAQRDQVELVATCFNLTRTKRLVKAVDSASLRIELSADSVLFTADNMAVSGAVSGKVVWSGYAGIPSVRVAGALVSSGNDGTFSIDPSLLSEVDSISVLASIGSDSDSRTITKLVQPGALDMTLSGNTFVFLPDGDVPKEGQAPIVVSVSKSGLASDINVWVDGQPVALAGDGTYTIYASSLIGKAVLDIEAVCGTLSRTARISKIKDGGTGISFSVLTSGVSFRYKADGTPYPGQSIGIWVDKSFAGDARVDVEGVGVILNPTKENPVTVTPDDMTDGIMSITATGEGLTRSAMIVRTLDGQKGDKGQSLVAQYSASETFEMEPVAEEVWFSTDYVGFGGDSLAFEPWTVIVPILHEGQYLWKREGYAELGRLPTEWQYYCVVNGYYQLTNAQAARSMSLMSMEKQPIVTNVSHIDVSVLPTSPDGLAQGDLWASADGILHIVL